MATYGRCLQAKPSCQRCRRLLTSAVLSMLCKASSGEPYVVHLALDAGGHVLSPGESSRRPVSLSQTTGEAPADPSIEEASDSVKMSIGGYGFHCLLPTSPRQSGEEARSIARYAVARRAAHFVGKCLHGRISDSAEPFELCIGDRFVAFGNSAVHEAHADQLLPPAGFEQHYVSSDRGLRAVVRCQCLLPQGPPIQEQPCKPGDLVLPAEGPEAQDLSLVVAGASEDEVLTLRWTSRLKTSELWTARREQLRAAADGRSCLGQHADENGEAKTGQLHLSAATTSESGFVVELQSVTCCSREELRTPEPVGTGAEEQPNVPKTDLDFRRLLTPLEGRCVTAQNGWWSYELCWPWHVRQLHFQTLPPQDATLASSDEKAPETPLFAAAQSIVGARGARLGRFGKSPLELRRAENGSGRGPSLLLGHRSRQQELVVELEGADQCQ
ncbi:unnamed protein product, partial [Polarella glacialis]